jgi:disulfide bond formation protein DsbB
MSQVSASKYFPPSHRLANMAIALFCAGLIAFALGLQLVLDLHPCPLCVSLRIAVMVVGVIALAAALHNPNRTGVRAYAVLQMLAALAGAAVAARHIWIQHLPEGQVPVCGPGLQYMFANFPLMDAFRLLLRGDGNCAIVDWTLLGLSIPEWVLACCTGLLAVNAWQIIRQPPR